ncbi:uncharacterized protein Pyn_28233 [Prunus yedoensis var. nudiflora]|uniref:Disease resistance protein At4g27190-like leucine-rich repeats domain-containing protein n=1 Tax=Prunus yedoensis var. nudiflora TaxID=2094558 RepID=A0A314XFZ0_PRUYE|nr:uncharacterized protein Pyn_28233 [Prunus yedoensis var. nudiflora]
METIVLAAASTEDNIHEEGKETNGSGAMTLFPKLLNSFTLYRLPRLERFCPDAYSFAWSSSMRSMHLRNCPKLKTLGFALVSKKLPAAVAENLSDDHVTPANLQTSSASHNLENLRVESCDLLEVIFLVQETPSTQAFDKLRELELGWLPMLSHIWEKGLQVSSGFGNLKSLAMEKIVGEVEGGGESVEDELTFPHLNDIKLKNLPKLESFCSQAYTLKWPTLEKVEVDECPKLKAFAPESLYV